MDLLNTTMTKIDYTPFDYFNTECEELILNWTNIGKYGVTEDDVQRFLQIMKQERDTFNKRKGDIENWVLAIQIMLGLITLPLTVICIYIAFRINDSGVFYLLLFLSICVEYLIWSNRFFIEKKVESHYKRDRQSNIKIEKYLEDCHWEWWKQNKE